jgi:hypothetical protein
MNLKPEAKMNRKFLLFSVLLLAWIPTAASAQSGTVIFRETGFPAADSAPAPESLLRHALPNAEFATAAELKERLNSAQLLVLPYGSPHSQKTPGPTSTASCNAAETCW